MFLFFRVENTDWFDCKWKMIPVPQTTEYQRHSFIPGKSDLSFKLFWFANFIRFQSVRMELPPHLTFPPNLSTEPFHPCLPLPFLQTTEFSWCAPTLPSAALKIIYRYFVYINHIIFVLLIKVACWHSQVSNDFRTCDSRSICNQSGLHVNQRNPITYLFSQFSNQDSFKCQWTTVMWSHHWQLITNVNILLVIISCTSIIIPFF